MNQQLEFCQERRQTKMVFKFAIIDLTEDIDYSSWFDLPSSPSSTICLSLQKSFTRAISTAGRVSKGLSHGFTVSAVEIKNSNRRQKKTPSNLSHNPAEDFNPQVLQPRLQLRRFMYHELEVATGNFSELNHVGGGGFGKVYKGVLSDGYIVAIKRLNSQGFQGLAEFQAEVQIGTMAMHRNLLQVLGFCDTTGQRSKQRKEPNEYLLVYPYMFHRSLESQLRIRPQLQPPLSWPTRMHIALGVARGLSYLHEFCNVQIIHRDIKPENIMLDKNFEPHIGDFGLGKIMNHKCRVQGSHNPEKPETTGQMAENKTINQGERGLTSEDHETYETTHICGTYGYIAPEYAVHGYLSVKHDVFSFGMVLLELIYSLRVLDLLHRLEKEKNVFQWFINLLEHENMEIQTTISFESDYEKNEVVKLLKLALLCTQSSPTRRPMMSEAVQILEGQSLDERWEISQKEGMVFSLAGFNYGLSSLNTLNSCLSKPDEEELSGPR